WIPARGEGLGARASVAEAVARPWPIPHPAEAIAIPNPAEIATQFAPPEVPPCANAGTAKQSADNAMNTFFKTPSVLRIVFSPMNCRQWVVDVTVQTPSR